MLHLHRFQRRTQNDKSRGFGRVSSHSDEHRSGDFFIFLAHDPLFQKDQVDAFLFPSTAPSLVEAQRVTVLITLDALGLQIEKLRKKVEFYQELAACEAWTALEAIKSANPRMGTEWSQRIVIDRKVHQMDPDFSFSKEIWNEPMPSLLGRERPT
jgi:hypothetical protein